MSSPRRLSGSLHHDDPSGGGGGGTAARPTFVTSSATRGAAHAALETSRRDEGTSSTSQSAAHAASETSRRDEGTSSTTQSAAHAASETSRRDEGASSTSQSAAHAASETSRRDEGASSTSQSAAHAASETSRPDEGASSTTQSAAHAASETSQRDEATSNNLTQSEADNGATGESNNNGSDHPTSPPTASTHVSPVTHVPQSVAQPDTILVQVQHTPSPRVDWRSTQERYMTAFSGARGEDDVQDESHSQGLRFDAPNNHDSRSTLVGRRGEFALPRWQPDAEVTYCPICRTQFSFFVRKHHCRKCGRVVCATCSPHRIIIPHQYIVRPPGFDFMVPPRLVLDPSGSGYFERTVLSGGERVRLCNPCVPDPNTAPPQSQSPSAGPNPSSLHHRTRSSLGGSPGMAHSSNRYGAVFTGTDTADPLRHYLRSRSITLNPLAQSSSSSATSARHMSAPDTDERETFQRILRRLEVGTVSPPRHSHASFGHESAASSSRQRALPLPPPIAEEDECPVCHRELPARSLPNFESLREAHINTCIRAHSTYGSPRRPQGEEAAPAPAPRRSGMYVYSATEKDCVDDAECTICLEEFAVGIPMARLECLCRFHKSCISAWFVGHPGRCPVHQHDGFGF